MIMPRFEVEEAITQMNKSQRIKELISQIGALEEFYTSLGLRSKNIKMTFKLMLDYLKGSSSKLEVKSFFETLMKQNAVMNEKELNLLVCFDNLIDKIEDETASLQELMSNTDIDFKNVA